MGWLSQVFFPLTKEYRHHYNNAIEGVISAIIERSSRDITVINSIIAWAAVICGLVAFFGYLDKTIEPSFKRSLSRWLTSFSERALSDIVAGLNQSFIRLFDRVYSRSNSRVDRLLVAWVFGSILFTFMYFIMYAPIDVSLLRLEEVLLIGFCAGVWAIGMQKLLGRFLQMLFPKAAKTDLNSVMEFLPTLAFRYTVLSIVVGLALGGVFAFTIFKITDHQKPLLLLPGCFMAITVCASASSVLGRNFVSPKRALLSSLFAIFVMAISFKSAAIEFFHAFRLLGFEAAGFILLNVFADTLSLEETRAVLPIGNKGPIRRFLGLLIIDVVLSGLIFLTIPIISGHLDVFIPAIVFSGDRPWLGIFFWSTFFTSFLFYLYLASCGVLVLSHRLAQVFVKLRGIMPIESQPIRCLGFIAMVIVTVLFLIKAIIW